MAATSGNNSTDWTGEPVRLPMDLCDNAPDWHRWVVQQVGAAGGGARDANAALRAFVVERFGPGVLDTHDWAYTPGSGRMLDHLLGSVPRAQRGAVLPTYQRVAGALPDGAPVTSIDVAAPDWSRARFTPPTQKPGLFVVNALHANPLASSLSPGFLTDVAGYARSTGLLLVEDDPFRGIGPRDDRWPTLLSLHPQGTVYLGSWTKVLGWPVKIGFVGWPRGCRSAEKLRAAAPTPEASALVDLAAVLTTDRAVGIRRRRDALLTSRRAAVAALLRTLDWPFVPPSGGAHLALLTGQDVRLRNILAAERIGGLDAAHFYPRSAPRTSRPFLRLGLSNVTEQEWDDLMAALERVLAHLEADFRDFGSVDDR
ncbi:aminotransferase class I/II-fold pyridoxal phosphate-dependent enzyme [Streptomyces sp. NPDC102279]|uniref:aminotransferase class I/II-fold pyridoxal phosphate-dependent enzyme n=1 Tax=Streptomyces sp. NPDC102279 TaxID=3366153 RepID=UPI00380DF1A7